MAKTTDPMIWNARVAKWIEYTKEQREAITKQATKHVIEDMMTEEAQGGTLPVDTGFLRNSIQTTAEGFSATGVGTHIGTIAGWSAESPLEAYFTANQAKYQEFGTRKMNGKHFVKNAVNRWQRHVKRAVDEAKRRRFK